MTMVLDKFRTLLPKTKTSPSGWISFNAPCCHNRGHSRDTRKRAGVMFTEGVVYNCFNCKFTANWQPGRQISEKFRNLCRWLGASDDVIKELVFEALKTESVEYQPEIYEPKLTFTEKELPEGAMPLAEWGNLIDGELEEKIGEDYTSVLRYLIDRGYDNPFNYDFYWSPIDGYKDRVIIPFRYDGKIVGHTARKVREGKPKYLSDQHPFFVFNVDKQVEDNRYIFVCEGPFDALSIGGVALLTNDIADQQARIIDSLGKEVIVIPDQDEAGYNLINKAMHYNWSVAFPTWDDNVKDCADAVLKYGKLFTIVDAIQSSVKGEIKIEMHKRRLEQKIKYRSLDV